MKTILTLEDELEINDFYKDLFEEFQYTVINATSYEEAIEIVKKQHIDLFVVDHLLQYSRSSKDGFQTACEVRALSPKTKIIMVSAHYPPELNTCHAQYGIDMVKKKPFDIRELLNDIKALLAEK